MQKTLAALAVCGAFAGSAMAADVTLYGILDTGVGYSHVDFDGQKEKTDNFSMMAGQASGSRWGLKGTEDLGNGLTVGFILESGLSPTLERIRAPQPFLTVSRACTCRAASARSASVAWGPSTTACRPGRRSA